MYTLAIYAYKTAYPVPLLSFLVSLSFSFFRFFLIPSEFIYELCMLLICVYWTSAKCRCPYELARFA